MIDKILIGTAANEDAGASMSVAVELAMSNNAELVILQVSPLVDARQLFDPEGVAADDHGAVNRLREAHPGLRLRSSTTQGYPLAAVYGAAAEEKPDLIVIGQHVSGRGSGLLSRRASRALVRRSQCTVLLVAS